MLQKHLYGLLAILGFITAFLVDITMIVPLSTIPIIVSIIIFLFYMYLLYLIIFRKIV